MNVSFDPYPPPVVYPPEVPHSVRNGPEKCRVVTTYIVEKDKLLASPAPES